MSTMKKVEFNITANMLDAIRELSKAYGVSQKKLMATMLKKQLMEVATKYNRTGSIYD